MSSRALLVIAIAACTPYDPSLSETPFFCGSADPQCPDGYQCIQQATGSAVCTTTMPGSGSGSGSSSGTCATPFTGMLATWDLAGAPGTQASSPATSMVPSLTAGALSRSSTLTATAGTDSINAASWPTTGQLDPASYFTLTIAAPNGCALDLTGAALDVKSSGTGPASAAIAASDTAFAQTTPVSTTAAGAVALSVANASGQVELRIFGFAASANTGTMRIENQLTISGSMH